MPEPIYSDLHDSQHALFWDVVEVAMPVLESTLGELRTSSPEAAAALLDQAAEVINQLLQQLRAFEATLSAPAEKNPSVVAQAQQPELEERAEKAEKNAASDEKAAVRRVLLAEDDALAATVVRHRLSRENTKVRYCTDGEEALQLLQAEPFDLAVLGATLPGIDGYELVSQLRAHDTLARLPIVLLAWGNNEQNIARAFDLGADEYITKPFSPIELTARLRRLLRRREPQPQPA